MKHPINDAISPEMAASNRAGIMLAKFFLYLIFLVFFFLAGSMLGAVTVGYNQEIIFRAQNTNNNALDLAGIWTWKSIFFYALIVFPISVGAIYLAHKSQRILSSKTVNKSDGLALADACFTGINGVGFCCGIFMGFLGTLVSISFQMGLD